MFIKLKSGTMLNLFYLQDAFQGKHDKSIVIFYLVNGVKLIEAYDSEDEALTRVDEVHTIMLSMDMGGGGTPSTGGDAKLEKTIVSNVPLGATNAGTTFPKDMTFTEFVEAIAKKSVTPTISATFTNMGAKEKGTSVNGTDMTLTITNLSLVSVKPTTINFYINGTLVNTQPFTNGVATYTYNYTTTINTDTTALTELVYGNNQKINTQRSIKFIYPSYVGVTTLDNLDNTSATALISSFTKLLKDTRSYTWNNIEVDDERFCYMYPKSYGPLTSIKDGNGFSQLDSYTQYTVSITSPSDGNVVDYYAYLLTDAVGGDGFTQIYS